MQEFLQEKINNLDSIIKGLRENPPEDAGIIWFAEVKRSILSEVLEEWKTS